MMGFPRVFLVTGIEYLVAQKGSTNPPRSPTPLPEWVAGSSGLVGQFPAESPLPRLEDRAQPGSLR